MININKLDLSGKDQNILCILNCIREMGEVSSNDISKKTGLSPSTVSRVIKFLLKKNLVTKKGKEITELGRRPELLSFNKNYGYLVHFSITSEFILGCISDLNGNILDEEKTDINSDVKTNTVLDIIKSIYTVLQDRNNIKKEKILAGSIGIPGIVDEERMVVHKIPNLADWENKNIFSLIKQALKVPVIVNNDSWLSAIGEKIRFLNNYSNVVLIKITSDAGIGAGLVIDNKLFTGSRNAAGEIGYMFFNQDNFEKYSNNRLGCLERYSGIKELYKNLYKAINDNKANILKELISKSDKKKINLELIEKAVRLGDKKVEKILDNAVRVWSIAIINICALLNPDVVVLGGVISKENQLILNRIRNYVEKGLYYTPIIRVSDIGERAQVIGGIHTLLNYVMNHILVRRIFN